MHTEHLEHWQHSHDFLPPAVERAERSTWLVISLTGVMMTVEIVAGSLFGSMALLADGWHMASHTAALGITAFAYVFARRHQNDDRFSYGTGKVGVLGGFTSAVVLAVIALLMAWESTGRFISPLPISFDEALPVACIGLIVNLASAWVLSRHGHAHGDGHGHGAHDHNLRAAYLHVLADALTSVLAIVALLAGRNFGWTWMDPAMGIVGAVLILRWSRGLLADTGRILLDGENDPERTRRMRQLIEGESDNKVTDLHVWRLSPHHLGAVISLVTHEPHPPEHYKKLLAKVRGLAHVTVEVNPCS